MPTLESIIDAIRELSLVDLDQLATRVNRTRGATPETLLDILVQEGHLTLFQAEHLLTGQQDKLTLGGYRLLELLGEGGMGKVYKAFQIRLRRKVALKVIGSHMVDDPHALKRFEREAFAVAALNHPNIVTVYDFDSEGSTYFIAMEYVEGSDLARLVKQRGPLNIREACIYIRQAADGLQHAHDAGIIHRDIKPHNLLLTYPSEGHKSRPTPTSSLASKLRTPGAGSSSLGRDPESAVIKILDMGLARSDRDENESSRTALTQSHALLGTPDFIAPEQARDARGVDGRADIYSLGCTLYYLLTGQVPFPDRNGVEKLIAHQSESPELVENLRPQTPPSVAAIVRRMMAKKPDMRYRHPREVAQAIDDALRVSVPVQLSVPPTVTPVALVVPNAPVEEDSNPQASPTVPGRIPIAPRPPAPAWAVSSSVVSNDDIKTQETSLRFGGSAHTPVQAVKAVTDAGDMASVPAAEPEVEVVRPECLAEWQAHRGHVSLLGFSADGSLLASCGIDNVAHVFETTMVPPPERANGVSPRLGTAGCMATAPSYPQVALGSSEAKGEILIWNWGQTHGSNLTVINSEAGVVHSLAYSPDGSMLVAGVGQNVYVFRVRGVDVKLRTTFKGHRLQVRSVAVGAGDQLIASGCEDGSIRIWSVGRLWAGEKAAIADHGGAVLAMAFSPDGNRLASIGEDQKIRVWDVGANAPGSVGIGQMDGVVRRLEWTPDGRGVMAINAGGHAVLWDIGVRSRRVREWQLGIGLLVSLSLLPDGSIAAGTSEGMIRVFQFTTPW